jgi:hypothetical protein
MYAGRQSVLKRSLHFIAGLALAADVGIAADYGIAPVQAAVVQAAATTVGAASAVKAGAESNFGASTAARAIGPDPGNGFIRLPGHVLDMPSAAYAVSSDAVQSLTLTLVLRRDDEAGFNRYLAKVYDSHSDSYRHFLSARQISARFGPSIRSYDQVVRFARSQGLTLAHRAKNRLTLTVRGSRDAVERALHIGIRDFRIGDATFYSSDSDPALPLDVAKHIETVGGLSNFAVPQPAVFLFNTCSTKANTLACLNTGIKQLNSLYASIACLFLNIGGFGILGVGTAAITPVVGAAGAGIYAGTGSLGLTVCPVGNIYQQYNAFRYHTGDPPPVSGSAHTTGPRAKRQAQISGAQPAPPLADGSGQTIGLLEFDGFHLSDVSDYLTAVLAPATAINSLSVKAVNGGVATPGAGEEEVLLDIDTVMSLAAGAKVVVYEAPSTGRASDYVTLFNTMIDDKVTVISNSWASCENQVSQADAQSIDTVLKAAAAAGISVLNGTGDSGATCLDGSSNTISVPADSPNATAVGGTSLPGSFGPGPTYGTEAWWDSTTATPPSGQSGFGTSKFFSQPAYQSGLTTGTMRSIPDVVIRADPANGVSLCQADNGGCPTGYLYGGTSLAAPEWAALTALLNDSLGKNVGFLNPVIYPLAATDAFHGPGSMSSDFAHVGLGSPNLNVMGRLLSNQAIGPVSASVSQAVALYQPATTVTTTSGGIAVPADGVSQGGVLVTLRDAMVNTLSGRTVTLSASGGNAVITPASGVSTVSNGAVVFTVTDLTAETLTLTATDTTDGVALPPVTLTFGVPPASSAGISANPPTLPADGQTAATVVVTMKDSLGRPTPGKTVDISTGGAHAVINGPTPGVTDANGEIQFSATDQVNEAVTFTAIDVSDNLPVPGSAMVTYSNSTSTACGVGVVPVPGTGFAITPYITGLPAAPTLFYNNVNEGCPGANNPAFPSSGTVLTSDFLTGGIYLTGLSGGTESSANLIGTLSPALGNIILGKDGSLYATQGSASGEIVQLNPVTGAVLRIVASGLTCPTGLAVDPLSGDLFFDDDCSGGGLDNASIFRIIDPADTDPAKPTSVVVYATLPNVANGAMAFAPNGTLYAVSGYFGNINAPVEQVSATNATTVTVTPVTGVTSDFAVAIGRTNSDGSAQSLIVEPAGTLSEVPIATPTAAVVLATGSPGVGVTGPDGCLYSAHYDTIYRLAPSSGNCAFAPTSPTPSIRLTPAAISANPAQGGSQTFTATVTNVSELSGLPVIFSVNGANGQIKLAVTDASGSASFSYAGVQAGTDVVSAAATADTTSLTSNSTKVNWTAGKHVTFLTTNLSPHAGTVAQPVTVVASLSDVSATPVVPIAAQTVMFTLGASTCSGTTDTSGTASCPLTPSQTGIGTLTASFAGTSQLVPASTAEGFSASTPPTPAPTVALAANPASVAAGSSATLTWSSTNAATCTASGSWSGSQATSGTASVTPAAVGNYTYTLTCAGNGGTASASTVLAANLVTITVTAKSGGGAINWYLCLLLGVLVMLRLRAGLTGRMAVGGVIACLIVSAAGTNSARADQTTAVPTDSAAFLDQMYLGIRIGGMPVHLDSAKLDQGLTSLGYSSVLANTDTSATGGTVYIGYQFNPATGMEFGYTHRSATVATLSGTIASTANLTPLLRDTAELIDGYGNIFSLSLRGRLEVAPRFSIDPRIGAFFWDTKVTAQGGVTSVQADHQGGGVTVGVGAAYRVWRGLELGVGVDYFRGSSNNVATLYAGSLEWRFGH